MAFPVHHNLGQTWQSQTKSSQTQEKIVKIADGHFTKKKKLEIQAEEKTTVNPC